MANESENREDCPVLSLIQQIKDGTLNPRMLDIEKRQICVEILMMGEGWTESQAAQLLKRSEKTIHRDILDIRGRNSLSPNVEFAKQFVGDVVRKGLGHHDYLVRLSRNKDISNADKIQAVASAWRVIEGLLDRLQNLGYLPLKKQTITGDFFHHFMTSDEKVMCDEIKNSIKDIETTATQTDGLGPGEQEEIKKIQSEVENFEKKIGQ